MLSQVAARRLPLFIRQSIRLFSTPVETPKPDAKPTTGAGAGSTMSGATHKVNKLEKTMLVWTGKYKSTDEVPSYVK